MSAAGVWAIVVAAGSGQRFGASKQYAFLGGRRVLDWAIEAAAATCEGVVAVVPRDRYAGLTTEPHAAIAVPGGATRSDSVRAGLAVVPEGAAVVVVHDGARPLASKELFESVIAAVWAGADGAVPGIPVADTVKRVRLPEVVDGRSRLPRHGGMDVLETLDRSGLVAVQTPQAFDATALRDAHAAKGDAGDDAALVEAAGGRVVVVPGEHRNLKLTHPDDLAVAEVLARAGRR